MSELSVSIMKFINGDVVTLENEHNLIIAIVNPKKWFMFRKVQLQTAKGLNREFARELVWTEYNKHIKECN